MMTNTYVPLATITLTAPDSEIVFSSIPATYRDLVLILQTQMVANGSDTFIRFNSDTGSNYSTVQMVGGPNGVQSASYTTTFIVPSNLIGEDNGRNNVRLQIMDYSATDKHKTCLLRNDHAIHTQAQANRWANTNAINTITVGVRGGSSFVAGSTFNLYGVAA